MTTTTTATGRRVTALGLGLVLGLGLAACGEDEGATGATSTPTTDATTSTSTTVEPTSTTTTTPDGGSEVGDAAEVVEAWLDALGTGDLDAAWARTHPSSQEAFGGRATFDDAASALAEGYGAWAGADDATFTAVALDDLQPGLAVVVVEGTVGKEGPPVPDADALVVRVEDGVALVDPFHDVVGPTFLEYDPPAGTEIAADGPLAVYVPVGREVRLVLDGTEVLVPTAEGADGDQERHQSSPPAPLAPGRHSLAVVVAADGVAQADATTYAVEG